MPKLKEKTLVDEIYDFIVKNSSVYRIVNKGEIKEIIEKHINYGTILIIREKTNDEIVAVVRWNWLGNYTVYVLDAVIRKDYRSMKFLKSILLLGVSKNPQCKWICFNRGLKYPFREGKIYKVDDMLRRR